MTGTGTDGGPTPNLIRSAPRTRLVCSGQRPYRLGLATVEAVPLLPCYFGAVFVPWPNRLPADTMNSAGRRPQLTVFGHRGGVAWGGVGWWGRGPGGRGGGGGGGVRGERLMHRLLWIAIPLALAGCGGSKSVPTLTVTCTGGVQLVGATSVPTTGLIAAAADGQTDGLGDVVNARPTISRFIQRWLGWGGTIGACVGPGSGEPGENRIDRCGATRHLQGRTAGTKRDERVRRGLPPPRSSPRAMCGGRSGAEA